MSLNGLSVSSSIVMFGIDEAMLLTSDKLQLDRVRSTIFVRVKRSGSIGTTSVPLKIRVSSVVLPAIGAMTYSVIPFL